MIEGFCRGCLIKYDESLELLQYTEKNRRLFVYATGLQVKRNDTFTFQICKDCYLNMKLACKFKKLCRTSDKKFKNYLSLKEIDDSIDLCNFIKQNDDDYNVRFPLISGNSTPVNQRLKDDDNESTCTSIRNFMTDILQGEEMPDTEARIVKEVIEEEADVLDESLDSIWLRDDASIDTDFQLDFSFSPFSTPHPIKNDHCYTPIKLSENRQNEEVNYYTSKAITEKPDQLDELNTINEAIKNIPNNDNESVLKDIEMSPSNNLDLLDGINNVSLGSNAQNYYVQRDIFDDNVDSKEINLKDENKTDNCTIDKNLEIALKNTSANKFSLDDLLVSPPVFPSGCGRMTPTIANILFSDKLESPSPMNENLGQCIENFQNVEGQCNLDDFFDNSKDYGSNDVIETIDHDYDENGDFLSKHELVDNDENEKNNITKIKFEKIDRDDIRDISLLGENFDIENLFCKLCEKKFDSLKSLRIHISKRHKIKVIMNKKVVRKQKDNICEVCGKIFKSKYYFMTHKKTCMVKNTEIYQCDTCLVNFTSQNKLNQHKKIHDLQSTLVTKSTYICNICGRSSSTKTNFTLHMRRHTKSYNFFCPECGKGFYRSTDLTNHKRNHSLERPFQCLHCFKYFSLKSGLVQHIKNIHFGRKYFCDCCNYNYKNKSELINHFKKRLKDRSWIENAARSTKNIISVTNSDDMKKYLVVGPILKVTDDSVNS